MRSRVRKARKKGSGGAAVVLKDWLSSWKCLFSGLSSEKMAESFLCGRQQQRGVLIGS